MKFVKEYMAQIVIGGILLMLGAIGILFTYWMNAELRSVKGTIMGVENTLEGSLKITETEIMGALDARTAKLEGKLQTQRADIEKLLNNQYSGVMSDIRVLSSHQSVNEDKLNQLIDVLPAFRRRTSLIEISSELLSAVVCTNPYQNDRGEWKSIVHVIDSQNSSQIVLRVSHANQADMRTSFILSGIAGVMEPRPNTFSDMAFYAEEIERPVSLPPFVNMDGSYVFRRQSADKFLSYIRSSISAEHVTTVHVSHSVNSWNSLAADLKTNEERFDPVNYEIQ